MIMNIMSFFVDMTISAFVILFTFFGVAIEAMFIGKVEDSGKWFLIGLAAFFINVVILILQLSGHMKAKKHKKFGRFLTTELITIPFSMAIAIGGIWIFTWFFGGPSEWGDFDRNYITSMVTVGFMGVGVLTNVIGFITAIISASKGRKTAAAAA